MDDVEYFAARERAERELAFATPDAKVREIHLTLAEKYAALAVGENRAANENGSMARQSQLPQF